MEGGNCDRNGLGSTVVNSKEGLGIPTRPTTQIPSELERLSEAIDRLQTTLCIAEERFSAVVLAEDSDGEKAGLAQAGHGLSLLASSIRGKAERIDTLTRRLELLIESCQL